MQPMAVFAANFAIVASELHSASNFQLQATTIIRTAGASQFRYEANHFNLKTAPESAGHPPHKRKINPTALPPKSHRQQRRFTTNLRHDLSP
jgi:hypothetical protein